MSHHDFASTDMCKQKLPLVISMIKHVLDESEKKNGHMNVLPIVSAQQVFLILKCFQVRHWLTATANWIALYINAMKVLATKDG